MSELFIRTEFQNGKSIIADSYYTAPLKIAKPFYHSGHTEIMQMCASAGLLENDNYQVRLEIGENSRIQLTTQSYAKLFRAEQNGAEQTVFADISGNAALFYLPGPAIPFAGSRFRAETEFHIKKKSTLVFCDILSCGRAAMGEQFQFTSYTSKTSVYLEDKLVFLDNSRLRPAQADLAGPGFFEGYNAQGMIYLYGMEPGRIPSLPGGEVSFSQAPEGILVRALANSADSIMHLAAAICGFLR